jgi:hypothetical protein
MNNPVEWVAILGVIFAHLFLITLVLVWWKLRQRRLELQAEVQTKLIERFGSSAELVEFLKSSTGREFVHGVQKGSIGAVAERSIAGIRKAVVLTFIGLGLLVIWGLSGADWISWFAIIFISLGLGYLAAAYVAMRLSRADADQLSNDPTRS